MTNTPLIELRHVLYRYGTSDNCILNGVDFHVNDEQIGIIGPNGSGKTTLLHIIVGLLQMEKGQLFLNGKEVKDKTDFRELRKEVGFLFQNSDDQLFSPTVLEDVAFGPLNLGLSIDEAKQRSIETLNGLGLYDFEDRITHMLSGGEKKLVALASILAMRPRLLLLDEPTNDLDPKTRERLIKILQELGKPCLIISHDWDFLDQTTDTLYSLEDGKMHRCEQDHIHTHRHIHTYGNQPHQHSDKGGR